jgi:hypothetical protein
MKGYSHPEYHGCKMEGYMKRVVVTVEKIFLGNIWKGNSVPKSHVIIAVAEISIPIVGGAIRFRRIPQFNLSLRMKINFHT